MITPNSKSTTSPSQTILAAIASFPINHNEYNWRPGQEIESESPMIMGTPKNHFAAKHFMKATRRK